MFTVVQFDDALRWLINRAKGDSQGVNGPSWTSATIATELTNMATLLGTDTTTNDWSVQTPPAGLLPVNPPSH